MTTAGTTETTWTARPDLSRTNRAGLVVLALLGLLDALTFLTGPSSETPGETGPPSEILVLDTVLGVVTLVGVAWAWRTASRTALRLTAGARILSVVSALPAFFVDVPPALKAAVAVFVVVTAVGLVMSLRSSARPRPV